ncbi:CobW family GTP-binding protein [Meridianimarinicoccus aquatilis]|uniref:CobW family GTP-binding protein n=1 Tax=Meridianimarinicoccus aquatilis TaxID=2552766 RepID=UPI001FB815A1|nr:GTP-binding protein [Fluviibacterium aquatile]
MTAGNTRVPVTILTGFLGAGKTTLLNALLSDASAGKIAVIVNEFGEAGLDHDLIETADDQIALMQSGCLCCSLRGELSETMERLLANRSAGTIAFDRVVIETTGLADPGPIMQTLTTDPALSRAVRIDGVVTVADAVNGPTTLDAQFEAVSQAATADLIVLSKADLASPDQLLAFEARLRRLNPGARIVPAIRGAGLSGQLWGLSPLRPGIAFSEAQNWTTLPAAQPDPLANLSRLSRPANEPAGRFLHDDRICTAS